MNSEKEYLEKIKTNLLSPKLKIFLKHFISKLYDPMGSRITEIYRINND